MEYAQIFIDNIFRLHGLLEVIISDQDPRFTGKFWRALFWLARYGSSVQYCVSSSDRWTVREDDSDAGEFLETVRQKTPLDLELVSGIGGVCGK